jgi:tyrosine-protein phosphatase SIW14
MSRPWQVGAGTVVVVALIVGPVIFAEREVAHKRNFRVVREGVLYRSGRMTKGALQRVLNDYGIRTVVCLRDGTTAADRGEEAFCNSEEINFVRIPPNRWEEFGGEPPAEEGVRKFREVMSDPRNHPVLLHCLAGIHRTGIFTAIYRMEFEHWSNERAMQEMRSCGYVELDEHLDVLGYLEQYRPQWLKADSSAPQGPHSSLTVPRSVRATVASLHAGPGVKPSPASKERRAGPRKSRSQERKTRSHSRLPAATGGDAVPAPRVPGLP